MSARAARRSFPVQLLVALARTSPAYTTGPRPGRSRGRKLLAALGRKPVAVQRANDAEAASSPSASPSGDLRSTTSGQDRSSAVADLLWSLPPMSRLSLRSHPAVLSIALTFQARLALGHALSLAHALDDLQSLSFNHTFDRAFARERTLALTRVLEHARAVASDLANDRDRDRDRARALDRGRARVLARDLARVLDLDRALATAVQGTDEVSRALDRDPAFALARARDLASDFAFALARDLALDRDLAPILDLVLDRDLASAVILERARDLDRARVLNLVIRRDLDRASRHDLALALALNGAHTAARARDLDRAMIDFTVADLRDADLTGLSLTGIRWSRATQWPPAWAERVEQASVEVEPGIFEIRGGTAHTDASTALVGV